MLVSDDTRAFEERTAPRIVIRGNKTRYSQFDVSEREIAEQTTPFGVVLNAYRNTDINAKVDKKVADLIGKTVLHGVYYYRRGVFDDGRDL
jgi:hypothetical protein